MAICDKFNESANGYETKKDVLESNGRRSLDDGRRREKDEKMRCGFVEVEVGM